MQLAVLASGSGTIFEAMLDAGVPVHLLIVDRPCRATEIAAERGIAIAELIRTEWGSSFDRDAYARQLTQTLQDHSVDLVVMAGFGTILGQPVYDVFAGRVLNTHPALLPSFPGWHAVEDAIAYGVKVTGCTVHVATLAVDDGPVLAQEAVAVLDGDDASSLHERIKVVERRLYVETVQKIVARGWVLDGEDISKEKAGA